MSCLVGEQAEGLAVARTHGAEVPAVERDDQIGPGEAVVRQLFDHDVLIGNPDSATGTAGRCQQSILPSGKTTLFQQFQNNASHRPGGTDDSNRLKHRIPLSSLRVQAYR